MTTRYWKRLVYCAAAALLTGCGGGGGGTTPGTALPPSGPAASAPAGKMVIAIPNATSSQSVHKKDISPAAASISIIVTAGTTSMAPQIADIGATSPNCTANASGRTCTIPVSATPGTNVTFAVTIFDGPNATGHQLATGSAQSAVVPGAPFNVNITLNGVISSLQFYLPADSNQDYPGPKAGEAGSGTGTIIAKDSSGNIIVGPYNTPVNISTSSSSITVAPATLTGSGPVQYTYDGGTSPTTLSATAGSGATAVSTNLTVSPQSNYVLYPAPTGNDFRIFKGPDNKLYVDELGPDVNTPGVGFIAGGPGKIARFDPATNTFTGEVTVGIGPIGIAWTPDASFWTANTWDAGSNGSISHVTGFSTVTTQVAPTSGGRARDITLGPDGNLWYVEQFGSGGPRTAHVGTFNPATPASISLYSLPVRSRGQSIITGPDANLWVADSYNMGVDKVTTSGTSTFFPIPTAGAPGTFTNFPRFMANGSDGNIYVSDIGNQTNAATGGTIWKVAPATGAMTSIPLPTAFSAPDSIAAGPPGTIYFSDIGIAALGVLNVASGSVVEYPFAQGCDLNNNTGPSGVTAGPDGSLYFTMGLCNAGGPLNGYVGHLLLAPGWRLYPLNKTIYLSPVGSTSSQLFGIAESGSSTFTVVSSAPSVASVTTVNPHNFTVNGVSPGSATITVSDTHGISVTRNIIVSAATATVSSVSRRVP